MRSPIFLDNETQKQFDQQGFVVVKFIDEDQLDALNHLFNQFHATLPGSGFFSSSYSSDLKYKQEVSQAIVNVLEKSYQNTFTNYTPFGASFLVKMPSENSALAVHQDWTIVDETKHYALNCWIPLTSITESNGPLMVLPGSHFDNYATLRAPTLNFFFSHDEEEVMKRLQPIIPKLGEAIVLNQSLIHYSPPNNSKTVRKAITAGVKTANTPMWFHYKNRETEKIERFEMPEDFLISFENFMEDIFKPPNGKFVGEVNFKDNVIRGHELQSILDGFTNPKQANQTPGVLNRILKYFNFDKK